MLRNIGGYDFVYAMVAALPLTIIAAGDSRGAKRAAFLVLLGLQTVMIVLSQYTYAMLFAAAILAVEALALLLRTLSRGRIKTGASLLWGTVPFVVIFLLRVPLVQLAVQVCEQFGLDKFAHSFEQLLLALQGQATSSDSRLSHYLVALEGFARSPLTGSMLGGEEMLSMHSEVLDLLSGMGVLGTAAVGGMMWLMGRGAFSGIGKHPRRAQLYMTAAAVLLTALLGTVVYSRDIPAVAALGALLVLEGEKL